MKAKLAFFFGKIWSGLKTWINEGFKTKKMAMAGFCLTWLVPLLSILAFVYFNRPAEKKSYPIWLILTLAVVIVVYYRKGKQVLRDKMLKAEIKGIAICPVYYLINGVLSVGSLWLIYWAVDVITSFRLIELQRYLIICMASVGSGAICYSTHAVNQMKPSELDFEGHNHDKQG